MQPEEIAKQMVDEFESLRTSQSLIDVEVSYEQLKQRIASAIAATQSRQYFCSCGGALTAEEYITHYFEMGHDRGDPAFKQQ
jgi:fructoselysine-6-P-deglycase FrlB-like protein